MSRDVENLIEPFRSSVKELIKRAKKAGLPILVTGTTRTIEEQRELVRKGYSKTMNSKHLTGEAADIAFLKGSKLSYDDSFYKELYSIIKDIPYVIWPYKDLGWGWDKPHVQYDPQKHGIIEDMKCEELLGKQKEALDQEIGRVTQERDDARKAHTKEIKEHKEAIELAQINYDKWQLEIDKRKKTEKKLKECNKKNFSGMSLFDKFKILFPNG